MMKIIQGDITTLAVDAIVNAVQIAVREVREFLTRWRRDAEGVEVIFCCISERDKEVCDAQV
jgi:O-acetyl-ADP-ribose deacetylase (regulator of RNase III)